MRHRKAGIKLNRTPSHRKAMFRNMVTSLLKHERIQTTVPKAKELRRWADHVITLAKRGDLHARRQALAIVREKDVVHKLFETANERFGSVSGGYTRIVKLGRRAGDAAPISLIELVVTQDTKKKKSKKKKAKTAAAPAKPAAAKKAAPKEVEPKKEVAADTAPADEVEKSEAKADDTVEKKADDPVEQKVEEAEAKSPAPEAEATDAEPEAQAAVKKDDKAEASGSDSPDETEKKE
jgi:large subunit ribosomal protein L17